MIDPTDFLRLMFDDGLPKRDLAVTGKDDFALMADSQHGGGVGRVHRRILLPSAGEGKARGHWGPVCGLAELKSAICLCGRLAVDLQRDTLVRGPSKGNLGSLP